MQHLLRRFKPIHLLLISINGMVGSAWLFAPYYASKLAGSGAIFAWLVGGLMTVLIALTFSELSVMLPISGGSTSIPKISHGQFSSFMMGWLAWLSSLTIAPIEVQAVLQYASTYFPSLIHTVNQIPTLTAIGLSWAAALMLLMCFINVYSFRGLVSTNFLILSYKLLVIALLVIMLPKTQFYTVNFTDLTSSVNSSTAWHNIFSAVSMGGIAFAYTGFKHGVELAGEATHKQLTIPLAVIGSVVCCAVLYIALQIVFIGAIEPDTLKKGWSALHFAHDAGPFAGILLAFGIGWLLKMLYLDAAISPLGAGLIYMTSTARITYAMAENGYLPRLLMRVNRQHLPIGAIALNFILGMLFFLPFSGWQAMVGFLVSVMITAYSMGPLSLLALRKQMPDATRLFKLPLHFVLCSLSFYCCILISYWTGWQTISKLAPLCAIGILVFFIALLRGKLNKQHLGLHSLQWFLPFVAGLTIISYLGDFGGKKVITFGWDFFVIAVFAIVILLLASTSRLSEKSSQELATEALLQEVNE
jgi:amino acid transporter